MTHHCCSLILTSQALENYGDQIGQPQLSRALEILGQTIAWNRRLSEIPGATLLLRREPYPAIAVFGDFSASTAQHVLCQLQILNNACENLRYVDYAKVTQACEKLAHGLTQKFSPAEIQHFRFLGIPRGGLIVLGILAYLLHLNAEQFHSPTDPETPIVIVDDCALSGGRFTESLAEFPDNPILFAPLFAHPDLRAAIAQTPNVLTCLSGEDLQDHGHSNLGETYQTWQAENINRLEGKRFWLGQPDYICFPWNEPDHLLWNPALQSLEKAWRILPGDLCLKNRPEIHHSPIPVQIQHDSQGGFHPHPDVIWMQTEDSVILGNLQTQQTFALEGVAGDIWRSLMTETDLNAVTLALVQDYSTSVDVVKPDIFEFVEQLTHRNLIHQWH